MKIEINTDKNILENEALAHSVETILEQVLARFSNQITRIEVHLSDENSAAKSGKADKRCLLEVRVARRQPETMIVQAQTVDQAVMAAAQKMASSLESKLGKFGKP
ncbi:MAG: ribosome-associated translation inhibitor RaiA [Enterobacterales bacterium]|jgi:ribosome-associated translation inhibitor RaiA